MPYQRVISTLGCAELTLRESIALATRHRIDGLELRALGDTLELPSYLQAQHGAPDLLARELSGRAVGVTAFDTSFRLTGGTEADRGKLLEFVPWAEALGVAVLRVFDGESSTDDTGKSAALESLRWWRELRQRHGWRVDLMIETHDSLLTSRQILDFVAAAPGTKILWDSHHTWKLRGEDPVVTWRAIAPHVAHIHVKDSVSVPQNQYAYTYVLPGTGEFPMAPLARLLQREYAGTIGLEWERRWHPYLPPLETALAAAAANAWW